jgi:phage shock protein A
MTLSARLSRLFQADMHAVLDKIEEPGMLLKQAIRDMEAAIEDDERQVRCWECEQQQLVNKHGQLAENLSELDAKLALCLESNKDDLARTLVRRKLETQRAQQLLADKLQALQDKASCLTKRLTGQQTQLAGMKQKAEAFLDDCRVVPAPWEYPATPVQDEDVEIAFLQEKQKRGAL